MATHEKQYGVELDDGQGGLVGLSAVEFILRVLQTQFLVHQEARMLRTGLDFFKFVPRMGERPEEWFSRFDRMLDEANRVSESGLSVAFRSWMPLSLLQFSPKRWSQILKDLQHRLPRTRAESVELQQTIPLEKAF